MARPDLRPPQARRPTPDLDTARILSDPAFKELVGRRTAFAWTLSVAMLVIYLAFVFLVAFAKPVMATAVGEGPASVGIVLGLLVIISAIALTGLYVQRANSVFDALVTRIVRKR